MSKILEKLNIFNKKDISTNAKPQSFVDLKRASSQISFINQGHPLYDNIVAKEENKLRILAPNQTAFDETSLTHIFVAIVNVNEQNFLVINSLKHFKEQSIGGLLQFDEKIYNVIPFFENDEEYQTAHDYTFSETYEYDHPVENYNLIFNSKYHSGKIALNRGKTPISIKMIDEIRPTFMQKLTGEELDIIDYVIIPAIKEHNDLLNTKKAL